MPGSSSTPPANASATDPNQPPLGSTTFISPGVTQLKPTGTYVGQRVEQMRNDLSTLQTNLAQRNNQLVDVRASVTNTSQRYHGNVAAIATRLQIGTTPANPVLVDQWKLAQGDLDRLAIDITAMNNLANQVSQDSSTASYLLESARATLTLPGAIDEDHRQLRILEDETSRTNVQIDRLLTELSADVSRQTSYIGGERANLTVLAAAINQGQLYGPALAGTSRGFAGMASPGAAAATVAAQGGPQALSGPQSFDGRQPLVIIRFDRADVPYQQALYNAVSRALERRPDARFDLVSVAVAQGSPTQSALAVNQSRRNAERVLRSLSDMGLPAARVTVSSQTSPQIAANEVHIYVR